MGTLSDYLRKLEKNLVGMEEEEKKRVIKDVEAHILRMAQDYGGGAEGIRKAIEDLGPPEKIAEKYSELHSLRFQDYAVISAIALLISSFTLPIIPFTSEQNIFFLGVIIVLSAFIFFVGINWGMKAALVPSLISGIWRSSLFHITLWMYPLSLRATPTGIYVVHITSLLIVLMALVFPIPGKE